MKKHAKWMLIGVMAMLVITLLIGNKFVLEHLFSIAGASDGQVQTVPLVEQITQPSIASTTMVTANTIVADPTLQMNDVDPKIPLPTLPPDFIEIKKFVYSREWNAQEEEFIEAFYAMNAPLPGPVKYANEERVTETHAAALAIDGLYIEQDGDLIHVTLPERTLSKEEVKVVENQRNALMSYQDRISFWFNGPDPVHERTSRFLTDGEHQRRIYIIDRYQYDGLRPAVLFPTEPGEDGLYYDEEKDFIYLTQTYEMTDEQLLQYHDLLQRIGQKDLADKPEPLPGEIGEKEAIDLAREAISAMYGDDPSGLEVEANYASYSTLIEGNAWYINMIPKHSMLLDFEGKVYMRYNVTISPKSGRVLALFRQPQGLYNDYAIEMGIYAMREAEKKVYLAGPQWPEIARSEAEAMMAHDGSHQNIVEAEAYTMFNSNYDIGVEVKVSLSDGAAYVVHVSPKTLRMVGLDYYEKGYNIDHMR